MEEIISRTRGRDGRIIITMDGEIIKIICRDLKRTNNHKKRKWIWKKHLLICSLLIRPSWMKLRLIFKTNKSNCIIM